VTTRSRCFLKGRQNFRLSRGFEADEGTRTLDLLHGKCQGTVAASCAYPQPSPLSEGVTPGKSRLRPLVASEGPEVVSFAEGVGMLCLRPLRGSLARAGARL
jgi:hypothetical protein